MTAGCFRMLDNTITDAGNVDHINPGPAVFFCRPPLTPVSRRRLSTAVQLAEMLTAAAAFGIWLSDLIRANGGDIRLTELLAFSLAMSMAMHFILRGLSGYAFPNILNVWRSCVLAVLAWLLATSTLLCWTVQSGPRGGTWEVPCVDWVAGGMLIALVRLATAQTGHALLRTQRLRDNMIIIGNEVEAQLCARLIRADQ